MRVWPDSVPSGPSLSGTEGALVSISIDVDPRHLESLLETLAQIGFPINPQIFHDALVVFSHPDGREETEATTLVEFPAYADRIDEVREALERNGFDPATIEVTSMLDEIQSTSDPLHRIKRRTSAAIQ